MRSLLLSAIVCVWGCTGGGGETCTFLAAQDIDIAYEETQQCMEMLAAPPSSVEYQSFEHFGLPPAEGLYIPSARAVWINGDLAPSCGYATDILKHEYVHHILRENGYAVESATHNHVSFGTCGPILGEG